MASDSRVGTNAWAHELGESKVTIARDDLLVGHAGSSAERVLRAVDWDAQDLALEIDRHIKRLDMQGDADFELLIGRGGKLWYYDGRTVWPCADRYASIGSGSLVCLGYLAATPGVPPQDRVRGAVRAAITHVPTCGGKIWVHSCHAA